MQVSEDSGIEQARVIPSAPLVAAVDASLPAPAAVGARLFSLDVLRGVAIALVLVLHFPPTSIESSGWIESALQWVMSVGEIGVDLFFVLSGFLISGLIFKEFDRTGGFEAGRFWLRRGFKIWPSYFAAYGLMTVARIAWELVRADQAKAAGLARSAVCNGVFLQNYLDCARWSHSWSLAVEEHFYTVFALVIGVACWYRARGRPAGREMFAFLVPLFALIAVSVPLLRSLVLFPEYLEHGGIAYYRSHLRCDSLFFGVFLGYETRYRVTTARNWLFRWPVVAPAFALAFLWPTLSPRGVTPQAEFLGFTLVYLCFGLVVASASRNPGFGSNTPYLGRGLYRPLAWLGVYSYTVYLSHSVLFGIPGVQTIRLRTLELVEPMIGPVATLWLDRGVFLFASIIGGVMLSHLVERPFLRLRERVLPSGRLAQAAPP
jgi:peptidoglycan/LPS O-acetylase OafA/YrhL